MPSKISWTNETWNPIRARNKKTGAVGWFCTHASAGCVNCYAEGINRRLGTGIDYKPGHLKSGAVEVFLDHAVLDRLEEWKRPRMIFVCSMTDMFGDFVQPLWIAEMLAAMKASPQHTFQILTKRSANMRRMMSPLQILPNVWLGVSCEDQATADERIPDLLATPAAKRFISAEPLIGLIDLSPRLWGRDGPCDDCPRDVDCECGYRTRREIGLPTIDWLIAGGESGAKARPMHPVWARSLRDQCAAAGVPFHFKQWGTWVVGSLRKGGLCVVTDPNLLVNDPLADPQWMVRVAKKSAGNLLDGVEHLGFPA